MGKDITVGMDMGDKQHVVCILNGSGKVIKRDQVTNTAEGIRKYFKKLARCRVGLEAGTHSGWVSRILAELGHEVLVGNPRKLRMIWKSDKKDAETIAPLTRADPQLLYPIQHRGADAQIDLGIIKARDMLVKSRSMLITHAHGAVKSIGGADFNVQCGDVSWPAEQSDAGGVTQCAGTVDEDDRGADGPYS